MKSAEFFFDLGSPAAYVASAQMDGLAARTGAQIVWRPMLLGAVFKATGNASPAMVPAKSAWVTRDLARYAADYEIPFALNPYFPFNTLTLMRAVTAMELEGKLRACADALYPAIWAQGKDVSDPAVVAQILRDAGFDPDDVLAKAQSSAAKERLMATTQDAIARGAFGAPTFFVGNELFFGQDRISFVEKALKA